LCRASAVLILPDGLLLLSGRGKSTIHLFAGVGAFASVGGVILSAISAFAACGGGVIIVGVSVATLRVSVATLVVSVATLIISTSISVHGIYFLLLSHPLGLHPKRQVGRPGLFFDTHLIRRAGSVVDVSGRHVSTKQKDKMFSKKNSIGKFGSTSPINGYLGVPISHQNRNESTFWEL
jgi:hypothetical protein